ncbi:glycoside hydrolase family 38 C-terminal domain-containing protein [Actinoplanes sp. NBRC 103695]|uniref:alpha-mannosidase n=1 Tax=Actinoplanes sp. NBRC 103695 TaxID=3032202 RepID=UPI0024A176B0|nr:glycoside hydrolase family 38 C-terminal domain-containing protein [Actinoplanes sp. NBRC 103695]GLY92957.1 alpha-mannosidase [Actinoplanes sp. NBRC 103695]
MHSEDITQQRLDRALRDRINPAVAVPVAEVEVAAWEVRGEPVPFKVAREADYQPFPIGGRWGRPWDTIWFRITGTVPAEARGTRVELEVDLGWAGEQMPGFQSEGLVYDADGTVIKAVEPRNTWIPLPDAGSFELYLEAAANPKFFGNGVSQFAPSQLGDRRTAGEEELYTLDAAAVVVRDLALAGLVHDIELVAGLLNEPGVDVTLRALAVRALDRTLDLVDAYGTKDVELLREPLVKVLEAPASASAHTVSAVGHAHIDSAWLWPLRETRRKVARTVANVLQLMDENDDLVYVMSAAQHWAWLREDHPALFERAKQRVAEGRFVPVGGQWVESDTVLPGGEAMVRQFTEGARFFREHLGHETRVAWLPDSFGYSGALPQIVRQAGIDYFLTQKISWNRVNRFPHHTLEWVGIDGTSVFTHFPPADTYNGEITVKELNFSARNFKEKGAATRSLLPFGFGDGGGGPTREMLARARRAAGMEGVPKVRLEGPEAFFDAARAELPEPPQWYGELYLELHRGTLTSQAAMKRGNRRSEHLMREAELWAATAAVLGVADYPYDELRDHWQTVLLHQFHDILPGSSISWVHREARETYAELAVVLAALIEKSQEALAGPGDNAVVFDSRPTAGEAVIQSPASEARAEVDGRTLRSDRTEVTLGEDGTIVSLVDVATGTEAIAPGGRGGVLQLHPDYPAHWDAWDVDRHYRATVEDVTGVESSTFSVTEDGAAQAVVERAFGSSTARQTFTVRPGQAGVEIRVEVDWHEQHRLLKLGFDADVHADRARFETQFGHVTRATHENTSWDAARFEVAAHRWVHVGEPVGVALANDGTYGHEVRRVAREGGGMATQVRATLVRGPRFPDPDTDQGSHDLRFRFVPAATPADAVAAGYALNLPPVTRTGGRGVPALVRLEGSPGVLIEAVKLADDRSGDVVVRLYESLGTPGSTVVDTSFEATGFQRTDLHERPLPDLPENERSLSLRPFEIVTLRITRAA